jgi:hypothetical protein
MSPFINRKTLNHGTFDKNLIYPHHAWIPSDENLIEDELGFTLLDTGTAEKKHHLIGYNGAGSLESRITITVEADAPGGGSSVPAIIYNGSRFFRGQETFPEIPTNSYFEALWRAGGNIYWRRYWGTSDTSRTAGFYTEATNPYTKAAFGWKDSYYRLIDSNTRTKDMHCYWGFCCYYSRSTRAMFSTNGLRSYGSGNRLSTYPFCIGGSSGTPGGGTTPSYGEIGPILFYHNIAPASRDVFLRRRLELVQSGLWRPYIAREELRP